MTRPYALERGELRRRLARGEVTHGTFVGAATPVTAEVCAAAGVDWVLLDLGAAGVMFPRIDTADEAAECVRHLRYPPAGHRGVATYNRMCQYGLDPAALDRSDHDVLGVVQIETRPALDAVEDIAALDGVDVLFVGPRDLSHALDVPGHTRAPAYLAALERVLAAAKANGKAAGLLVPDGAAAARMSAAGWQFLAIGSDTTLLANAVVTELRTARTAP